MQLNLVKKEHLTSVRMSRDRLAYLSSGEGDLHPSMQSRWLTCDSNLQHAFCLSSERIVASSHPTPLIKLRTY